MLLTERSVLEDVLHSRPGRTKIKGSASIQKERAADANEVNIACSPAAAGLTRVRRVVLRETPPRYLDRGGLGLYRGRGAEVKKIKSARGGKGRARV